MRMFNRISAVGMLVAATGLVGGCTEEISPQQPAQAKTPQPSAQPGPLTSQASEGGGSALGGAKRTATNIANQAEEASRRTAEEADRTGDN